MIRYHELAHVHYRRVYRQRPMSLSKSFTALALCGLIASVTMGLKSPATSSSAQAETFARAAPCGSDGKTPHEGLTLSYVCRPSHKAVYFKWGYKAGGRLRINEQRFAVRFTPTAIVQFDEATFFVCGATGTGKVVIEQWDVKHPAQVPTASISISTGEIDYPDYIASIAARHDKAQKAFASNEYPDAAFVCQGTSNPSLFLRMNDSERLYKVDTKLSTWDVIFDGGDPTSSVYLPALAMNSSGTMSLRTASLGEIYIFYRSLNTPSSHQALALVLSDTDRDGVIDTAVDFTDWDSYKTYTGFSPTSVLDVYF